MILKITICFTIKRRFSKNTIREICMDKLLLKSKYLKNVKEYKTFYRTQVKYHLNGINCIRNKSNLNEQHLIKTSNLK